MKTKLFHKLEKDKMYGTTKLGARGQVVIPSEARKDLKLKPGDQLLVLGKMGKVLGLVKTDELQELINVIMKHVEGSGYEKEIKSHLQKSLGKLI